MKSAQLVKLTVPLLCLAFVLGFSVADIQAQTSAPPAPPAQQEGAPQPAPSATDKGAAPQPAAPEVRGERPAQPSPNVTIDNRRETSPANGRGTILGVDATIAMVIGAVLVVVIVIALVAMSKRTEDVPTHRSV